MNETLFRALCAWMAKPESVMPEIHPMAPIQRDPKGRMFYFTTTDDEGEPDGLVEILLRGDGTAIYERDNNTRTRRLIRTVEELEAILATVK